MVGTICSMLVGLIVINKCLKFRDPRLNRSGEIRFSNMDNCRPEVAGDVISSVALDHIGMDVAVKLDDSWSSGRPVLRAFAQYLVAFCR